MNKNKQLLEIIKNQNNLITLLYTFTIKCLVCLDDEKFGLLTKDADILVLQQEINRLLDQTNKQLEDPNGPTENRRQSSPKN
jgi:hypothetical protein